MSLSCKIIENWWSRCDPCRPSTPAAPDPTTASSRQIAIGPPSAPLRSECHPNLCRRGGRPWLAQCVPGPWSQLSSYLTLFLYLLINPMNSKRVSSLPYWMLFSLSISWISSSVASWPNLRIASRHSCIIAPSPESRYCRCRQYRTPRRSRTVLWTPGVPPCSSCRWWPHPSCPSCASLSIYYRKNN